MCALARALRPPRATGPTQGRRSARRVPLCTYIYIYNIYMYIYIYDT